ncbi:MAG: HEAT repeat domain-containing protein [Myxococcota bacterium]
MAHRATTSILRIVVGAALASAGLGLGACSGISDCGDDAAKCAELLNQNAAACAAAFQLKQMDSKRKACAHAVDEAGDEKIEAAVPGLLAIVSAPESGVHDDNHRSEAAKALGKIASKDAVEGLLAAIDFSVGTSGDPKDKMGNRSNEEIAEALGSIGDARAVPKLVQLMERTRDNNVALWAMRSLGKIRSPDAVEPLTKMALEHENKFMRKNAVVALGDIGDPSAIDALVQMMFIEFQGVSFYKEASFALFQVGPEAVDELLETMAMKNEAVNAVFEQSGGAKDSAVIAKCAVVLGDLRDKAAVEPLIDQYEKAIKKNDPIVIREVAFALGSLNDPRAVPALMKNMGTIDASLRERVMESLNKIGDRQPVPQMIGATTASDFVKRCVKEGIGKSACEGDLLSRARAQKAAADMATHLVDADNLEALKKAFDGEENAELKKYFEDRFAAAQLVGECKDDVPCWAKKAESDNALVREKAYWELGRIQGPEAQKILAKGLRDRKRKARAAAIYSYWKFGDSSVVPQLEQQLEKEAGAADFLVVNEDLKRLYLSLKRQEA